MKSRLLLAAGVLALAACATESLPVMQRRAIAGIQTAQQGYTKALAAGTITMQQHDAAMARLAAARAAIAAATTPAEISAATSTAGVTP